MSDTGGNNDRNEDTGMEASSSSGGRIESAVENAVDNLFALIGGDADLERVMTVIASRVKDNLQATKWDIRSETRLRTVVSGVSKLADDTKTWFAGRPTGRQRERKDPNWPIDTLPEDVDVPADSPGMEGVVVKEEEAIAASPLTEVKIEEPDEMDFAAGVNSALMPTDDSVLPKEEVVELDQAGPLHDVDKSNSDPIKQEEDVDNTELRLQMEIDKSNSMVTSLREMAKDFGLGVPAPSVSQEELFPNEIVKLEDEEGEDDQMESQPIERQNVNSRNIVKTTKQSATKRKIKGEMFESQAKRPRRSCSQKISYKEVVEGNYDKDPEYAPEESDVENDAIDSKVLRIKKNEDSSDDEDDENDVVDDKKKPDLSKEYVCDTCSNRYANKRSLRRHKKSHLEDETDRRPYECAICGSRFTQAVHLKSHEKIHLPDSDPNKRTYKCDHCPKTFTESRTRNKHIKTHLDDNDPSQARIKRPFKCKVCRQAFRRPEILKNHMILHADSEEARKPFACADCGSRFSHNGTLYKHKKSHCPGSKVAKTSRDDESPEGTPPGIEEDDDYQAVLQ